MVLASRTFEWIRRKCARAAPEIQLPREDLFQEIQLCIARWVISDRPCQNLKGMFVNIAVDRLIDLKRRPRRTLVPIDDCNHMLVGRFYAPQDRIMFRRTLETALEHASLKPKHRELVEKILEKVESGARDHRDAIACLVQDKYGNSETLRHRWMETRKRLLTDDRFKAAFKSSRTVKLYGRA